MRRLATLLVTLALAVVAMAGLSRAQESSDAEKSAFLTYVEEQLSTPERQIRFNGLSGALSSSVKVEEITVADETGVWLRITDAALEWSRAALLSGRLEIDRLQAARIALPRLPQTADAPPSPEASTFALPELPLAVVLKALETPLIEIGEPVFGLEATLSVEGRLVLDEGSFDTALSIQRADGVPGRLDIAAAYAPANTDLSIDVTLNEPSDGVLANLFNIPGRPATSLKITGDAPLDNFDLRLAFDVERRRILEGDLMLRREGGVLNADLDVGGPLGTIMAPRERAFFGMSSRLVAEAAFADGGGINLNRFALDSGLIEVTGSARTLPDGFPERLDITARLANVDGTATALPFADGTASMDGAEWTLAWGDNGRWSTDLRLANYRTTELTIGELALDGGGEIKNAADPGTRSASFDLGGTLRGLDSETPGLARALGDAVRLALEGDWSAGAPLALEQLTIQGSNLDIQSSGTVTGTTFDGTAAIVAGDLSAFAEIAERDLEGSARLSVHGTVEPLGGGFDLTVDGTADDLQLDQPEADALLAGQTRLSGRVERGPEGLLFDRFELASPELTASVNGRYSTETADLGLEAAITDIAAVNDNTAGRLTLDAGLTGIAPPFALKAELALDSGRLAGLAASGTRFSFDGTLHDAELNGDLVGTGLLGGAPIELEARLQSTEDATGFTGLKASIGPTRIEGGLLINTRDLMSGRLTVTSTDIRAAAALALVEAGGALDAEIGLSPGQDDMQGISIDARGTSLTFDDNRVGEFTARAEIGDLFGLDAIDADISASDAALAGIVVRQLAATARTAARQTDITASGDLAGGTRIAGAAQLSPRDDGFEALVSSLALTSPLGDVTLAAPATVTRTADTTRLSAMRFAIAGGTLSLDGSIADTIDLRATLAAVPLDIINTLRPDLGAAGILNGTARISGPSSDPAIGFDLSGSGLSAQPMRVYGIAPLALTASGNGTRSAVRISSARMTNAQGLDMTARGTTTIEGAGGLDMTVEGSAPLAIAAPLLATRGTQLDGRARFNIAASGQLTAPRARGFVSIESGSVADPLTNLRLQNITLVAGLDGDRVTVNRFSAGFAEGGTLTATGSIGLTGDLPANLSATLTDAVYTDAQTLRAELGGRLQVSGSLARDPLVSGQINLIETEITVPESFASSDTLLDVVDIAPPAGLRQTRARIARATPPATPSARPSVARLDLAVNAPNRIFVRGRGIDAELGGNIRLTGPVTRLQPVGAFRLIRGRLSVLGKRLDFDEGTITFTGDLNPNLNLVARTSTSKADAFVTVSGSASSPEIVFSSQPELPQDEILALVIFDRNLAELSPIQIARLANAATELTGGRNTSLTGALREGAGLDDLDIVSDDDGNTALRVGKYISDNIYFGVQAGTTSEATVNLDVTDDLTVRGSVDTEGDSSLGLFFEKDY